MGKSTLLWALLASSVLVSGVLGLYAAGAPKDEREPFSNSVQQRADMINELREIKSLLKEQNALLRAEFAEDEQP